MKAAIVGGDLIDGTDGSSRPNRTVVFENGIITEVSDRRTFEPDVTVIDATGKAVMPGLIDSHVHFAGWAQWLISAGGNRLMLMASQTVAGMRRALEWGVTSTRDMGGLEVGFAQAVTRGIVPGPRLQTVVAIIQTTNGVVDNLPSQGGYFNCFGQSMRIPGTPDPHADGPWEMRKKVREVMLAGADAIKIASSSISMHGVLDLAEPSMTVEELDAIVAEAHSHRFQVVDHVMGRAAAERAVKCGVDTIEHGTDVDDRTLGLMAERGIFLVPMFWILDFHIKMDPTDDTREHHKRAVDTTADTVRRAVRAGVKIAMGSDGGTHCPVGNFSAQELEWMTKAGMSAKDAIVSATRIAAECLRLDDRTGTIVAGRRADLLVVDGNPLHDIRVLQNAEKLSLIVKDGAAVGGSMTARDLATIAALQTARVS